MEKTGTTVITRKPRWPGKTRTSENTNRNNASGLLFLIFST
jgi:hypothetical protein